MKRSSVFYMVGIILFLLLVFMAMQLRARKFRWEPTFLPTDDQPFGAQLFDSLMRVSLPHGYRVADDAAAEWVRRSDSSRRQSVLYVRPDGTWIDTTEVRALLRMAERGDRVMVVNSFPSEFADTLNYIMERYYGTTFDFRTIQRKVTALGTIPYDTLRLEATGAYPATVIRWVEGLGGCAINTKKSKVPTQTLAVKLKREGVMYFNKDGGIVKQYGSAPVAVSFIWGKGKIYIVSPTLPFTNYGVTDEACRTFVMRMMNELSVYPVVRLYERRSDGWGQEGSLSFFASQPPLRLAWHLFVVGAVLLLVVNARRRQRAISVWRKMPNATLSLLAQQASLYRKRTDYAPLLKCAYRAFAAELLKEWHIDVADTAVLVRREQVRHLSRYLEHGEFEVARDLQTLDSLLIPGTFITPKMYRQAMELMRSLAPKAII